MGGPACYPGIINVAAPSAPRTLRGTKESHNVCMSASFRGSQRTNRRNDAWQMVCRARMALKAEQRIRSRSSRQGATGAATIRADQRVVIAAYDLAVLLSQYRNDLQGLTEQIIKGIGSIPPPKLCDCGCNQLVRLARTGRLSRFAKAACRNRAFRRRMARVPEDAPSVRTGGRSSLRTRLAGWYYDRRTLTRLLTDDIQLFRETLRAEYRLSGSELRSALKHLREEVGLRNKTVN
jgi:hypothetical protein